MKKTSEKIAAFAANVASLTDALDEAADMVEAMEAQIAGADALREINKKLGNRAEELEAQIAQQNEQLETLRRLAEHQRVLTGMPGYVGLLFYVAEFSAKHQISTATVWDMFFSVCKRTVFAIPEPPEPVEPKTIN